ncbi:hypothetical protein GCK72_000376 [Caenorhabditis remanei]|nr:hypothetical protein GCK72_000376 [Caenorhabditis remanei]KAF1768564.1 hypothetical protein GCK72_000376 [Caenorhabditis remanei]
MGINIPVKLETSQTIGNEINFRSRPFVFNGIWVKVVGTMNTETLDGRVRFERFQRETRVPRVISQLTDIKRIPEVEEETIGLTEAEMAALRREGLNI